VKHYTFWTTSVDVFVCIRFFLQLYAILIDTDNISGRSVPEMYGTWFLFIYLFVVRSYTTYMTARHTVRTVKTVQDSTKHKH